MSALKSKAPNPSVKALLKNPILLLGFGFGSGLSPKGPGTAGTLLGMILFIPLLLWNETAAWALLVFSLVVGSYICGASAKQMKVHDHGGIVWDEFAGIWLVIVLLPEQTWLYWILAFIGFRIFDIAKPWPINWADSKIAGGFGIMVDDVLAALYAVALIWLVQLAIVNV